MVSQLILAVFRKATQSGTSSTQTCVLTFLKLYRVSMYRQMRISTANNTHGNVSQGEIVVNITLSFQDSVGAIAIAILAGSILFEAFLFKRDVLSDPCSCGNNSTQISLDVEYPYGDGLSQDSEVVPVTNLELSNSHQQYIEQTEFLVQSFAKSVSGMPHTRTLFGLVSPSYEVTPFIERPSARSVLDLGPRSIPTWSIPVFSSNESSLNGIGQLTVQKSNNSNMNPINSLVGSRQPISFNFERLPSFVEENLVLPSNTPVSDQSPGDELTEVPSTSPVIPVENAEGALKIFEPHGLIGSALAAIIGFLVVSVGKKDK